MAEFVTNRAKLSILNGDTPLDTSDLRMAYVTGAGVSGITLGTFQDLNFVSELDAITNVTISTERVTLTGEGVTEDDTNNWALADFADAVFGAVAETAEGAIVYKEGANDAARELLSLHTTGFPQPVNGGLTVNTPNGWLRGS